ncbi:MAG: 3-deoxy-manno-octulosonate cytidylyltransferase [Oceanococcaceae bacterium]
MTVRIVIPARMASSRLPGKVMAMLGDRPVVGHAVNAAQRSGLGDVWVATDAPEVAAWAQSHRVAVGMTRSDHPSGSDRIHELAVAQGWPDEDIVVNLQGDEPYMPVELLRAVARALEQSPADWATVAVPIADPAEFANPACVKVVCSTAGDALYFSRAPIPHPRDGDERACRPLRHVGLYAYRVGALARYCQIAPTPLEQTEKLEQLRALESGMRIRVHVASVAPPAGIDTPADLERARQQLATTGIR